MHLKYSQFNIVNEVERGVYSFYNAKSGKHLIFNHEIKESFVDYFSQDNFIPKLPVEAREALVKYDFIVDQQSDEHEELEKMKKLDQEKNYAGLFLTILPTLQCNFSCSYCFENADIKGVMSEKTQSNLIQFVEFKLSTGVKDKVQVKWFGGEPLLEKNLILKLSNKIQKQAALFGVEYQSTMVTNGYLLDRLSKEDISDLNLTTIQVTLDGLEKTHNKRRPAKDGGNSFQRILENIEKTAQFFKNIVIRINIDKENAGEIHLLLKLLKDRGAFDLCKQVYFAFVDTEIGRYSAESQCASGMNRQEIADLYDIISLNLKNEGLEDIEPLHYPKFLSVSCDAQIKNYYVINPEGFVFKCNSDASFKERSLFNLNTKELINPSREEKFLKFTAMDNPKCRSCRSLPVCQGGCVSKYIDLEKRNEPYCWPACHIESQRLIKLSRRHLK